MTLRRMLFFALLPTAVKLTIWILLRKSIQHSLNRNAKIARAIELKNAGYSNAEIADALGLRESMIRELLV